MATVRYVAGCLMRDEKLQSDHPHTRSLPTRRTVVAAGPRRDGRASRLGAPAGVYGGRRPC